MEDGCNMNDIDISARGQFVVVQCKLGYVKSSESAIVLQHNNISSSVLTRHGIFNLVPREDNDLEQDE